MAFERLFTPDAEGNVSIAQLQQWMCYGLSGMSLDEAEFSAAACRSGLLGAAWPANAASSPWRSRWPATRRGATGRVGLLPMRWP